MAYAADPLHRQTMTVLEQFFRSVADGDHARAIGLLDRSPAIATSVAAVGATRGDDKPFFLETIARHVYAGDTALHIAAAAYDAAIARRLLDAGADPHARNRRGATPLHSASVGSPGSPRWNPEAQAATIALLIERGAIVDATDSDGATPLHRAVRTRCSAAVRALLSGGANANRANDAGSTPLHLAVQTTGRGGVGSDDARAEQAEIIRVLLAAGARVGTRDGRGRTVQQAIRSERLRALFDATA